VIDSLKTHLRDLLPKRYQVPAKYWYGWLRSTLEPEMKFLDIIVRSDDRVIDIGGNRGVYAYPLWRLGARVEVFEPNPLCCDILTVWACDKPSVNVYSVALSSHPGSANLHVPVDDAGVAHDASASIENTGFAHARHVPVCLRTLDSFGFQDVSLIKIDVEGHEYRVIDGAAETLISGRPALLVEIEQRHCDRPIAEVFERILGFGYRGFFIRAGQLQTLSNFDLSRDQSMQSFNDPTTDYINNFLFLHQTRLTAGEYSSLVSSGLLK